MKSILQKTLARTLVLFIFFFGINQSMQAQIIYGAAGSNYTQNFDNLLVTVPANNTQIASVLPTGWSFVEVGSNANTSFRIDNGSSNSGDTFFDGATTSNERALGAFASGSLASQFGAVFTNTTGTTLTQFTLTYTGEQWRDGGSATSILNKLTFSYAVNPASLTSGTYTNVPSLDFTALVNNLTADAVTDGNAVNRRTTITFTVEGISWEDGQTLYLRWTDINDAGNDDNLAVDDLTFSASAVPSVISADGTLNTITTVYGSTSVSPTTFGVSGSGISGGILVTAPVGYFVSLLPSSGYASSVLVPGTGTITSTPVYVSLSTTATVLGSPYSGDIVLSSAGATPVNVATVASSVTPKDLTITGIFANSKIFDGNTNATLGGTAVLAGVINGDEVILGGTPVATFASSAVGTGIAVSVIGYSISGAGAGNYTLIQPSLTADITSSPPPAINSALTTSAAYGTLAPTYTITATETPTSFNATGLPSGLTVNTSTGEITGTPTAAPGLYPVTISATNAGGTGNATLDYTITPKNLTVTGAVADNKIYNRTTPATISGSTLVGIFGADDVTISNTGTFAIATVATGITVTSTQILGGANAANYTLTVPTGLTADITPKALTISGATALSKVYDGNTTATLTGTLFGVISPDVVTLNLSGTFASSAIGSGIAVTSTSTITGADAGNYTLTQPAGLTANITDTIIYSNVFTGASVCPTPGNIPTVATNAIGAPLTRSTITCTVAANVFNSTTLNNTTSPSATSYIEFSATANAGHILNVTSVSFFRQGSASAPNQMEVRYSTDGFATSTLWNSAPLTTTSGTAVTWDFTDFSSTTAGTVTFRIYPYGTQRADLGAATASTAGTFRVDDVTIYGNVEPVPVNSVVNLKLFIQGYYEAAGLMRSVKNLQDNVSPLTDVEDITVDLHNTSAPYEVLHTTTALLKTDGTAVATFASAPAGSFYISISNDNAIKTWSKLAQTVGGTTSYDFSTAATQAFGDNMINLGGVFAFYSGDINQDGSIDGSDAPDLFDAVDNSLFGVQITDLNGDGSVDNSDVPLYLDNSDLSIYSHDPNNP